MITEKLITDAWVHLRSTNNSIPDEVLDFIKDSSIAALTKQCSNNGINELAKQVHQNAKDHGFFDKEKNIGEMLCLIHSEVSEALEADRKDHHAVKTWNIEKNVPMLDLERKADQRYFIQEFEVAIKNSFEDELADIIIRVMDLAAFKGIDLEKHIALKMKYNSLREYKHSKKY